MTITGQSSLPKDEIDRMMRDAEAHAAEDKSRREEAEVRNQADTLVYQTEKLLKEQGEKITGDERDKVESALAQLKTAIAGSDVEAIKTGVEGLGQASQGFASRLYQEASAQQAGGQSGPSTDGERPSDDDVVDAEIVDEDEKAG